MERTTPESTPRLQASAPHQREDIWPRQIWGAPDPFTQRFFDGMGFRAWNPQARKSNEPTEELWALPSTSAFNVNSKTQYKPKKPSLFCPFCNVPDWPQDCKSVTDIDVSVQKLKTAGRCFLCTNRGHVRSCPRKDKAFCIKYKREHHVSICKNSNPDLIPLTAENEVNIFVSNVTHLQTAKLFITGPTGITKLTRCILDGGSQSSFVFTRLIDILNLKVISTDNIEVRGIESHSRETQPRRRVQLELFSIWSKSSVSLSAFESSNTHVPHQTVPTEITLFARQQKLKLADPYEKTDNFPIEILIEADFYWTVMTVKLPKKLTESSFDASRIWMDAKWF
ncbi:hypothetical protein AVEN_196006-1 [Araneus ventricosus]|uniref:Uncharacterized protein n=1 Tax=Araneus ventricosus TaxID=182803 RepID=A0A4Y2DUU0_ARAVE|nr:hypothetical protein AVEN_196006-1 [Araneus ventricosus]